MNDQTPAHLLEAWIARRAPPAATAWLDEACRAPADRAFGVAFGQVGRRVGRAEMQLSEAERAAAERACAGWMPARWSLDQAARVLLLLRGAAGDPAFVVRLQRLLATADLGETIAIHLGLPLYPASDALTALACDGLRTSMRGVFEAIAQASPFPAVAFDEAAWNQMVLKALFIETALDPIQGLDRRRNARLARTLLDYAAERRAAGRRVPPDLWRCVGPFALRDGHAALAGVLRDGASLERAAAALALIEDASPEANALLAADPALAGAVRAGAVTWAMVARGAADLLGDAA